VASFYHALDVFWVTSRIEGGPIPLLEAMSSGLPVVSTPVGMAREVIVDGMNGYLVPFDDPAAYLRITAALASDLGKRRDVGAQARQTLLDQLSPVEAMKPVRELYATARREFLSRKGPASSLPVSSSAADRSGSALADFRARGRIRRGRALEHLSYRDFLLDV